VPNQSFPPPSRLTLSPPKGLHSIAVSVCHFQVPPARGACCCFQSCLQLHCAPVSPPASPLSIASAENAVLAPNSSGFIPSHQSPLLPGADAQAVPVQIPELQRQVKGSSASMTCQMSTEDTVHWYKQLPGEPPKRILYVWRQSPVFDDSSDRRRFQVRKHPTEPLYDLTLDYLTPRDSGTYYCAYWSYQDITALDRQRSAVQKGVLCSEPRALNSTRNADTSLFHPSQQFIVTTVTWMMLVISVLFQYSHFSGTVTSGQIRGALLCRWRLDCTESPHLTANAAGLSV